ncbi:MAG: metal-dependent transcriptional regulator [Clostridia bacterium]|nr:metal-dependent transcriptional regulator [Clostridia bacterium]
MSLYESGENYLETILILKEKYGYVRSIDVARELNVSKPSVSRAVSVLKNDGYISLDQNGMIVLTDEGTRVANKIYERHNIITKHLISLGVSEEVASNDACKIEHVLSDETFEKIKNIVDTIK